MALKKWIKVPLFVALFPDYIAYFKKWEKNSLFFIITVLDTRGRRILEDQIGVGHLITFQHGFMRMRHDRPCRL